MKTLMAGFKNVRRAPFAMAPLTLEGIVGAVFVLIGIWPASAGTAAATAVFPFDIYFDVKQGIAYSSSWFEFLLVLLVSVIVRTTVLSACLYLSDHGEQSALRYKYWLASIRWAVLSAVAFIPAAALYYMGVAARYSPFILVAGVLGVPAVAFGARKVMGILVEGGAPSSSTPTLFEALAYGYVLCFVGAALAVLGRQNVGLAALLLALAGPLNALVLLGWRERFRTGSTSKSAISVAIVTVAVALALGGIAIVDRFASSPPQRNPRPMATLLLLGGQDSTMHSSDLQDIHLSEVGFDRRHARIVSYRGLGRSYTKADTHGSLDRIAQKVSAQIAQVKRPVLLGHSQAALIMDRVLAEGRPAPLREVEMAPPPVYPPPVSAPPPGKNGAGRPGADLARVTDWLLQRGGFPTFDIDAPASPVHLRKVVVKHPKIPRLAIFSVDDATWLTGDWRRPESINVISLADHSGVVGDKYALNVTRRFFEGKKVPSDGRSWKSFLVDAISYAYGPWKPDR